jgi:hypothetical protein
MYGRFPLYFVFLSVRFANTNAICRSGRRYNR